VNYTIAAVLAVMAVVAVDLLVARTRLLRRKAFWTAYGIVLFFQLIVNGLLTGLRIVRYNRGAITGVRIAFAPIEDLLFGFALVTLTLILWVAVGRRAPARAEPATPPATR
jgi:lycopene cyclase domain-containing protein